MVPPFHIPSLERYIPFNCPFSPSYSEYHISLPLHLPQLVKSLPFFIYVKPEKGAPFWRSLPVQAIMGSTPASPLKCALDIL